MAHLTDRWAFTQAELQDPSACKGDDMFWAETFPENEKDEPERILVNRRGEILNQYGDGSFGVSGEARTDLDTEVLIKESDDNTSETYLADEWKNVVVTKGGKFIRFQEAKT